MHTKLQIISTCHLWNLRYKWIIAAYPSSCTFLVNINTLSRWRIQICFNQIKACSFRILTALNHGTLLVRKSSFKNDSCRKMESNMVLVWWQQLIDHYCLTREIYRTLFKIDSSNDRVSRPIAALYMGESTFYSRPGGRLFWSLLLFHSELHEYFGIVPWGKPRWFPFQFFIHTHLTSRSCITNVGKKSLNK
jgi:hypothetical protein